ncbi:hypothetical protein PM10SUCC1_02230 [Propionigenium maris DSM 9537]|uniref:PhaC PHA synthase n=1 Tax=Propionigenium maris DSM 9537 TaxID=1123000 RepID=A0A9W6LLT3_9FUSO|nr:hypothetical protein [Propionigenium maris]GLI54708.1 hypothetical protein PM10SUCC1_02230 [Propionigenium maris DSM 9537]
MKKIIILLGVMALALTSFAEERETHYFDAAIWAPKLQIHSEESDISGLRLGLFYAEHESVRGVDLSVFASKIKGDFTGLQLGAWYNVVEGSAKGFQIGGANINGYMRGVQLGLVNINGSSEGLQLGGVNKGGETRGVQIGLVNYSEKHSGLMIGLYNHAKVMNGVQIGLANYVGNNETLKVMPLMNFHFGL